MSQFSSSSSKSSADIEEHEKCKNREETGRKSTEGARWTTVDSSGSENDRHERSRRRKRSESSSDSSSSESSYERKHQKKHHHEKKHRKHKSDRHDKHDRHDRHHAHNRDRHKSSKHSREDKDRRTRNISQPCHSRAVNQNEYGKYGIIREDSYFQKQKEFEVYMEEVKKIPDVACLPRRDAMEYFKCYIEDYNTATMPHEKYYSYAKWESDKYQENQARMAGRSRNPDYVYPDNDEDTGVVGGGLTDEQILQRERRIERERQQQRDFEQLKTRMTLSTGARDDMRRQEQLRGELQVAYRSGDSKTIARLEKVLKPDDMQAATKHKEKLLGNKGGWK